MGFSSFESSIPHPKYPVYLAVVSIPYWDFLVLNHVQRRKKIGYERYAFNSLLGFSSFESRVEELSKIDGVKAFNSLLGFSSFESLTVRLLSYFIRRASFNSLLGFSSFESVLAGNPIHTGRGVFQFPIGIF